MCIAIEQFRYDAFSFTVFFLVARGVPLNGGIASLRLRFVSKIGLKLFRFCLFAFMVAFLL